MNDAEDRIRKYRFLGATIGTALGIFASLVIAGPHIHEWTTLAIALTFTGCVAMGALLGYTAVEVIIGSVAGSSGIGTGGFGGSDGGSGSDATGDSQGHHGHSGHDNSHADHGGHSD